MVSINEYAWSILVGLLLVLIDETCNMVSGLLFKSQLNSTMEVKG